MQWVNYTLNFGEISTHVMLLHSAIWQWIFPANFYLTLFYFFLCCFLILSRTLFKRFALWLLKHNLNISNTKTQVQTKRWCCQHFRDGKKIYVYYFCTSISHVCNSMAGTAEFSTLFTWIYSLCTRFPHHHPT